MSFALFSLFSFFLYFPIYSLFSPFYFVLMWLTLCDWWNSLSLLSSSFSISHLHEVFIPTHTKKSFLFHFHRPKQTSIGLSVPCAAGRLASTTIHRFLDLSLLLLALTCAGTSQAHQLPVKSNEPSLSSEESNEISLLSEKPDEMYQSSGESDEMYQSSEESDEMYQSSEESKDASLSSEESKDASLSSEESKDASLSSEESNEMYPITRGRRAKINVMSSLTTKGHVVSRLCTALQKSSARAGCTPQTGAAVVGRFFGHSKGAFICSLLKKLASRLATPAICTLSRPQRQRRNRRQQQRQNRLKQRQN